MTTTATLISLFLFASILLRLTFGQQTADHNELQCVVNEADGSTTCSRAPCSDLNPICRYWASRGECDNNAAYMHKHCRSSCALCTEIEDADCTNFHSLCDTWAATGECILNPNYVHHVCPAACFQCINVTALRNRKDNPLDENDIALRILYARESHGVQQSIGISQADKAKIKPTLIAMEQYMIHNVTRLPRDQRKVCINNDTECAFWAAENQCEENILFMMPNCPLACQFCGEALARFQKCNGKRLPDAKPLLNSSADGSIDSIYQRLLNQHMRVASTRSIKNDPDDPWVLAKNDFVSKDSANSLIQLMKDQEWKPSIVPLHVTRRTSMSAFCFNECAKNPIYTSLLFNISTLFSIPLPYMEPLEFVHSTYMQSYGVHSDYNAQDLYLPAGPRIFSWYLFLSDTGSGGGGAMGFPNLDWLSIPPQTGQLLIWPNVYSSDPWKKAPSMVSEGLPVLGDDDNSLYGVYGWIRLYDYNTAHDLGCV